MKTTIVTKPTIYPVSLAEAKKHLRVTDSNDDSYIKAIIAAATNRAESYMVRKIITQTWKMYLDSWPAEIKTFFGNLQSVTHIKYTDVDEDQSTFANTNYLVDTDDVPGRVVLKNNVSYPSDTLSPKNPIEVQFVTGFPSDASVGAAIFEPVDGVGLDDATAAGTYTGTDVALYEVKISTAAGTDKFQWRKNGGAWSAEVAIDGSAQAIELGITITFAATTGHTLNTSWSFYAGSTIPDDLIHAIKYLITHFYEIRENEIVGTTVSPVVKNTFEDLLYPYRIWDWLT